MPYLIIKINNLILKIIIKTIKYLLKKTNKIYNSNNFKIKIRIMNNKKLNKFKM